MQENVALRDARLMGRKTLKDVAEAMGISINAYCAYERGEKVVFPNADKAIVAAQYLGSTVEELFSPDNVRETDNDDAEGDN